VFKKKNIALFFVFLAQIILFGHNNSLHSHYEKTDDNELILNNTNFNSLANSETTDSKHCISHIFTNIKSNCSINKYSNSLFLMDTNPKTILLLNCNLSSYKKDTYYLTNCFIDKFKPLRAPPIG